MTGGPTMVELDLRAACGAGSAQRIEVAFADAGLAMTLPHDGAITVFALHDSGDLRAERACARDLVTHNARAAAMCAALRKQFTPIGLSVPCLSVAICTKDRTDLLARLLGSMLPLRAAHMFDVLVVDNAPSDDATRRVAEAAEGVRYLQGPLAGLDFARNRAFREATGDVLAFLDDDVIVDPGWAAGLLPAWSENPDAGALTGLVMPLALDTEAQVLFEKRCGFRRGFRPLGYGATISRNPMHLADAGKFGAGANMSCDRALSEGLGGFDEALDTGSLLPGGGDLDIFCRVLRAGRPLVYEPRATVHHEHRREISVFRRQYYAWGLGCSAYLTKTMRSDPKMRLAVRRLLLWWFGYQGHRLAARALRRYPTPIPMIWAEIYGGIRSLCGEYGRCQHRSAAIRVGGAIGMRVETSCGVRHVDLSAPLADLVPGDAEQMLLAVFEWHGMPSGKQYFSTGELPVPGAALAGIAGDACAPAPAALGLDPGEGASHLLEEVQAAAESVEGSLSVVIWARNRPHDLKRCLDSILFSAVQPDETVVVDNASDSDTTRAVVSEYPVSYVAEAGPGRSMARNTGVAAAHGQFLVFTDDDVEVIRHWLMPLRAGFADSDVGCVTGLVLPAHLTGDAAFAFEVDHGGLGARFTPARYDRSLLDQPFGEVPPVWRLGAGANMATRRKTLSAENLGLVEGGAGLVAVSAVAKILK